MGALAHSIREVAHRIISPPPALRQGVQPVSFDKRREPEKIKPWLKRKQQSADAEQQKLPPSNQPPPGAVSDAAKAAMMMRQNYKVKETYGTASYDPVPISVSFHRPSRHLLARPRQQQ